MADENGGAFPLVDRPTPFADRIRNRVSQNNLGEAMGKRLGEFLNSQDEVSKVQVASELGEGFRESLAEEIGIEPQMISDDVVERMTSLFTEPDEGEVLTEEAREALGIAEVSGEDADEDDREFDPDEAADRLNEEEDSGTFSAE